MKKTDAIRRVKAVLATWQDVITPLGTIECSKVLVNNGWNANRALSVFGICKGGRFGPDPGDDRCYDMYIAEIVHALELLGLVDEVDEKAFCIWERARSNRSRDRERVRRLATEASVYGYELVRKPKGKR